MTKQPEGIGEFQALLGKLVKVPKSQVDREVERQRAKGKLAKKKARKRKK